MVKLQEFSKTATRSVYHLYIPAKAIEQAGLAKGDELSVTVLRRGRLLIERDARGRNDDVPQTAADARAPAPRDQPANEELPALPQEAPGSALPQQDLAPEAAR